MGREENMYGGMNAGVVLIVDTREDVLSIPVEALVEEGGLSFVYTGYDEGKGLLLDPVEVTTGISDGFRAEILSGLSEGDIIWYSYLDTLPIADVLGEIPPMTF